VQSTQSAHSTPVTRPGPPAIDRNQRRRQKYPQKHLHQSKTPIVSSLIQESVQWVWAIALAYGITLAVLLALLHPSRQDGFRLVVYLGLGGLTSIALGMTALWLIDTLSLGGIRLKVAIPTLLTALVIASNVLLIAKLMFISSEDGQLLLAFLVFGIAIATLLSSSIAARMTDSIRHIGSGAMRLAAGDYSFRIEQSAASGKDELTHLAHWFNQMADSVQTAFERQEMAERERKEVIAAVSHDLRTPLASVRAMVEAIDDGIATDPATIARYHHTIRTELRHLTALLDDLFELSRIESGALSLARDSMPIEDLISDALESVHEQAEQGRINLIGQVEESLPALQIDARQIHRALANLLQNAIRHTPPGGTILILATQTQTSQSDTVSEDQQSSIMIQVIDTGEGVAASDLPHIFDRSYRGETSRHRSQSQCFDTRMESACAGLGLAITRGIIQAHGGHIAAESPLPPEVAAIIGHVAGYTPATPGTVLAFTLPSG
jgi:signal transduction histidine kinase